MRLPMPRIAECLRLLFLENQLKSETLTKTALITGISGQDGSYLTEFLLKKGYEVHGILKRNSVSENQTARLDDIYDKLHLHYGDLNDLSSLISVLQNVKPDEVTQENVVPPIKENIDVVKKEESKENSSSQYWLLLWSKSPHNPESFYSCGD